jgi:hypothetical protein
MNPKLKKAIVVFGPLVVGIGAIYFLNRKRKEEIDSAETILPGQELNIPVQSAPAPTSMFPLKQGSNNSKVKELQSILGVTADGAFGPKTEDALVKFAGVRSVDSQAQLDEIKRKAQGSTNFNRAMDLFNRFNKGGQAIYVIKSTQTLQAIVDTFGAIIYTGKAITLPGGKVYNNQDYKITGVTKTGNLQVTVTRGTLAGMYIFDPNNITLKAV